jgi:hypothetical protein
MNHYTKLTILGVRLAALYLFLSGITILFYGVVQSLFTLEFYAIRGSFLSCSPHLLCGGALFALAKPVGWWLSRGIE